jgi:mRNA interferase MazF
VRRGEIVWVDLAPVRGSEANKRRPAVLVSNDGANAMAERIGGGVLTVVPVTTNVSRILPFQVFLPADECSLVEDSKAQAEQVRSVDVQRIVGRAGEVPPRILAQLDDALRLHLGL